MTLQATLIATTVLYRERIAAETPYVAHPFPSSAETVMAADELTEFAGRSVHSTWDRPNPNLATNADYLMRLRELGETQHFAHASATYWVTGGSHALVSELLPHAPYLRVTGSSLRYQRLGDAALALPAALEFEDDICSDLEDTMETAVTDASDTEFVLRRHGFSNRAARDAAIAFLPMSTEVTLLMTGDLEAWPVVINASLAHDSSAEFFTLGTQVLSSLRQVAPNTVSGIVPVRRKRPADGLAGEAVSELEEYSECG